MGCHRALLVCCAAMVASVPAFMCRAQVEIGGVVYEHVDPGEPFTAATQPAETHEPPSPTRAERAAGLIAYYRPAPELLFPWSRPRAEECIRRPLKMFAALGEIEPTWIALYALGDLSAITARLEGLPAGVG
ncbi:MAG: hypothetical protein H5T86_06745, partial [Armatimonadetes bacterium]|nr:hypothetical protein [Armatimonadota bacterium]